jgi:shikimate kinase
VIVLIGFMGAGKSTVGREVASRLGLPFVDSDSVIEERERRSVAEIFAHDGEPAFRSVERRTVLDLLAGPPAVLALGGGAVEDPVTRAEVARATTVHLVVSAEQATMRVGRDPVRPLLVAADPGPLLERRLPHYDEAARIRVLTDGRSVAAVVDDVVDHVRAVQDRATSGLVTLRALPPPDGGPARR